MNKVDWSKAPEWAQEFGETKLGQQAWICDLGYSRVPGSGLRWAWRPHFDRQDFNIIETRPVVWSGEGLPPIGTKCEFNVGAGVWRLCEIIAIKDEHAICWINMNKIIATRGICLRPIRTSEQIAAEEREKAAQALFELVNPEGKWHKFDDNGKDRYRAAIDAGYRKKEQDK